MRGQPSRLQVVASLFARRILRNRLPPALPASRRISCTSCGWAGGELQLGHTTAWASNIQR
eukprot:1177782-Prorocentrum_minimum.AAC.1